VAGLSRYSGFLLLSKQDKDEGDEIRKNHGQIHAFRKPVNQIGRERLLSEKPLLTI
jgi:hypothetical protein